MEKRNLPALTPLEGAMLPAIEMKRTPRKAFAALHTALERWERIEHAAEESETMGATVPKRENPQEVSRRLAKAAYAYVMKKRKG